MSPLEAHVNSNAEKTMLKRLAWERRCRYLPDFPGEFIRAKIWKWPYRHMRSFPLSVGIEPTRPGAWTISLNGNDITTTLPLAEWIGPINRPVTIVAGGPTARDHPMGELESSGRLIIAVNGVPAFLAEHGIRPDAWIVSDPRLALQIETNFPHAPGTPLALTAGAAASVASRAPVELAARPLCLIERVNQWHRVPSLSRDQVLELNARSGSPFSFPPDGGGKSIIGWSRRPELGFFSGCTVVFAALQLVVGLGARDIEIIGMDLGGTGHSYREGKGDLPNTLKDDYEMRILPSFEMMHEALRGTDVAIRNLSPVCPLPHRFFAQ